MIMMKEPNVIAPLRKEMKDIVEKRRSATWGSTEWTALNNRFHELMICWATSRIDNMEANLKNYWAR